MTDLTPIEYYAGQALNGVLSSEPVSSVVMRLASQAFHEHENSMYLATSVARLAWNVAEEMVREGKKRGHIPQN